MWIYAFETGACSPENKELDLLELEVQVVVSVSVTEVLETMSSSRAVSRPKSLLLHSPVLTVPDCPQGTCPSQ